MKKKNLSFLVLLIGLVFISCTSVKGSAMVTGTQRPAISQSNVRLFHPSVAALLVFFC